MGYNWISNGLAQAVKAIGRKLTRGIDYPREEELLFLTPTRFICVDDLARLNYVGWHEVSY